MTPLAITGADDPALPVVRGWVADPADAPAPLPGPVSSSAGCSRRRGPGERRRPGRRRTPAAAHRRRHPARRPGPLRRLRRGGRRRRPRGVAGGADRDQRRDRGARAGRPRAAARGEHVHRRSQPAVRRRVVGLRPVRRVHLVALDTGREGRREVPEAAEADPVPSTRELRADPLPRHGHRGRRAAHRPVPRRRPAGELRRVGHVGDLPQHAERVPGGLDRARRRRGDHDLPRRRARLALHALPHHGLPALAPGALGPPVHARHAGLRHHPDPELLGRAPGHGPGPGRSAIPVPASGAASP